jgi:excisionase family DNA binding protein
MTIAELATQLRVSRPTAYRLVRANLIPGGFQITGARGQWRVNRDTIEEWIADQINGRTAAEETKRPQQN